MSKQPEGVLIYDINSLPVHVGLEMDKIMQLYKEEKVVLYSSITEIGERADAPQYIPLNDIEVSFVDVSREENLKNLNGYKKRLK